MPVRTTTYNKSSMLQRDLPNANFICTDGDSLKFIPSAGDNKVAGLAQNTYHPPESKSVLWNSVKLNWTRQALSNYNLLTQNQSNACEDGTTAGFWSQSSATLTASTTEHYEGSYSLKVVTPGAASGEGMATYNVKATPGYKYSAKARVKGSGTVVLQLVERDSAGTSIAWTYSSVITLTSSWQEINVSQMFTMGVNVNLKVLTSGTQAITFYVDTLQINAGDPAPWVEGPASDFKVTASLLGLTNNGEESLIGEKIINTCPTTETSEVISFNLLSSACQTQFTRESGTAAPGKIQLNLPKRYSNYESITLNRNWLNGWAKRKTATITGSSDGKQINYVIKGITITYDSDMKTDFSDIRFCDADGETLLNYNLVSKTDGNSATFDVLIPSIPAYPATKNIYVYYGNSTAISASTTTIYDLYDNLDSLTGWTTVLGTWSDGGDYIYNTSAGTFARIKKAFSDTGGKSYRFRIRANNTGDYPWAGLMIRSPNTDYASYDQGYLILCYTNGTNGNSVKIFTVTNGAIASTLSSVTYNFTTGQWYDVEIKCAPSGTNNLKVLINGSQVTSATASTYSTGSVIRFFNTSTTGVRHDFDELKISKYTLNEPIISSWSAEESTQIANPDSANPDDTVINFTAPSDWSANSYAYLNFKEYNSFNITTRIIPLSVQNIAFLGYNGLDAFNALRLKIESECNDDYTFKFNNFKFRYII